MINPRYQFFVLTVAAGILASAITAQEIDDQRQQIIALGNLNSPPKVTVAEDYRSDGELRAIFFDALPWQGRDTKVFAWLGLPENRKSRVPGIVLVHGGGGTAFKEWVKLWNERGFAAISIAVEGQIDRRVVPQAGKQRREWKSHAWPGPKRVGIYGDTTQPLKDQWMYHAVADTVLANTLLRSLPEVNDEKVGLMGISWGGVITSTVVGIDSRFDFAIPTYGCGNLDNAENQYGRALKNNQIYKQLWDPMQRMGRAKMPILWFSWPEDSHFPLDCQADSYRLAQGPQMISLVPKMRHGHAPPWNRPESYAFAESVVKTGKPWCKQINSQISQATYKATFASEKLFDQAELVSTTDQGVTGDRTWIVSPAKLQQKDKQWIASAKLPPNTTACFINLTSGKLVVSSEFHEIKR